MPRRRRGDADVRRRRSLPRRWHLRSRDRRLSPDDAKDFKKRIVEVNALVYETQHMKINNIDIPFRTFDAANILDAAVPEYTGTKTLHGIRGYSQESKITIEQDLPLKMTLLGLEYKVATHQGT